MSVDNEAGRAISAALSRYCTTFDEARFDEFAALFERGRWFMVPEPGAGPVRQWIDRRVVLYDGSPRTRHEVSGLVVDADEDPDKAAFRCSITITEAAGRRRAPPGPWALHRNLPQEGRPVVVARPRDAARADRRTEHPHQSRWTHLRAVDRLPADPAAERKHTVRTTNVASPRRPRRRALEGVTNCVAHSPPTDPARPRPKRHHRIGDEPGAEGVVRTWTPPAGQSARNLPRRAWLTVLEHRRTPMHHRHHPGVR